MEMLFSMESDFVPVEIYIYFRPRGDRPPLRRYWATLVKGMVTQYLENEICCKHLHSLRQFILSFYENNTSLYMKNMWDKVVFNRIIITSLFNIINISKQNSIKNNFSWWIYLLRGWTVVLKQKYLPAKIITRKMW